MAAGIATGPSHRAVTNGLAIRIANDEAVTTNATLAWPAMISSRSEVA